MVHAILKRWIVALALFLPSAIFASGVGGQGLIYGPYVRGLKISYVSNAVNHVLWDDAILVNTSSVTIRNNNPGSLRTLDMTTNGANGLDTGSRKASSWYYVYLISDGTNFNGLYSLVTSSPTMPAGYTYKLLVGTIRTDASSATLVSIQIGQHVEYENLNQLVHDTTHNNAFQITSAASFVPPNLAWLVDYEILVGASYGSGGNHEISISAGPNYGGSGVARIQQDMLWNVAAGSPQLTWTGTLTAFNEPTPEITWIAFFDGSPVAFNIFVYVTGYTLTEVPAF